METMHPQVKPTIFVRSTYLFEKLVKCKKHESNITTLDYIAEDFSSEDFVIEGLISMWLPKKPCTPTSSQPVVLRSIYLMTNQSNARDTTQISPLLTL